MIIKLLALFEVISFIFLYKFCLTPVAFSERLIEDDFFSIDLSKLACFWQSYRAYYYDVLRVYAKQ